MLIWLKPQRSMSKKTKKEKIIADLRRQLETTKQSKWEIRNEKLDNEVRAEKKENQKSNFPFPSPTSQIQFPTSIMFIKKDLTKTLLLSILAISFELVLYFVLRAGTL